MTPHRLNLRQLESSQKFVFHGSAEDVSELAPHQAHKFGKDDGAPAVFASASADFAAFFALMNQKNCPLGHHAGVESYSFKDGHYEARFKASKATLDQLNGDSSGFVYVFDRKDFVLREPGGIEYERRTPVKPVAKVRVTKEDILGHITVTND